MLYEWRVYEVVPGRMGDLHERFQKTALRLFEKHGIRVVGFWEAFVGTSNILYYMIAWEDASQMEKAWNAFRSDPEWLKARQETEREGPIVERIHNILLRPTPYSPMK
ncbi:NIPSNAP family protein [Candidatus Bathyarchaeota archaeon]|nr:NIPSNAP family protein [Candidatus Bathyarchaeota archaeon]